MNVLVTGALGNVGEHTVAALLAEGHDIVAFDVASPRARKIAAQLDERVRVVWGDITDPASPARRWKAWMRWSIWRPSSQRRRRPISHVG